MAIKGESSIKINDLETHSNKSGSEYDLEKFEEIEKGDHELTEPEVIKDYSESTEYKQRNKSHMLTEASLDRKKPPKLAMNSEMKIM